MKKTIADFLWFVEERNLIQSNKEAGHDWPWSTNRILNETKFTCLDRNDDYGTKSLFAFVDGMDLFSTIFYVVYFRCFWSVRTFFPQMKGHWKTDFEIVKNDGIKAGVRMPYQIRFGSMSATSFLTNYAFPVVERIHRDFKSFNSSTIEDAANRIAQYFVNEGHFRQIFLSTEIAKDLSAIFPNMIDPNSWCPFNKGALAGLQRLPRGNWKEKAIQVINASGMTPSQAEHSLCEWNQFVEREEYLDGDETREFIKSWIYTPSKKVIKFVSPWNNYQFKKAV